MTIGDRIRATREESHMTQKELAKILGVSESYISQYERNIRNPKIETLRKLATALDCDFYWLFRGDDYPIDEQSADHVMTLFNTDDWHIHKASRVAVSFAERLHKEKGYTFSPCEERIVQAFSRLNDDGQSVAVERVEELTEIPKYRREETPPAGTEDAAESE